MNTRLLLPLTAGLLLAGLLLLTPGSQAQTPPVVRSLDFNGTYSGVVYYPVEPWMNTNLSHFTVEAWVYPRRLWACASPSRSKVSAP